MKRMIVLIVLITSLLLTGCSQADEGAADDAETETQSGTQLIMLIFTLETTDQAVTPEQAQQQLPLWKAVRAIMESDTAAAEELEAVYQQIEVTFTADQLEWKDDLAADPEALAQLMDELGVPMMGSGSAAGSLEAEPGVEPPPEGGPGGGPGGGGTGDMDLTPEQQATLQAEREAAGAGTSMGRAGALIDPLIDLLEARAAE